MGLFSREKKIKASVKEVEWINSLLDEYGTTTSSSGIRISRDTALKVAAVYSCVKVISNQIAQLPMGVYRTTEKGRIKDKKYLSEGLSLRNLLHGRAKNRRTRNNQILAFKPRDKQRKNKGSNQPKN